MLCEHCGMDIPFVGDICPHCHKPKIESQASHMSGLVFGVIGAFVGGSLGYEINGFIGGIVLGFIGLVVFITLGILSAQYNIKKSKVNKPSPTLINRENQHQQVNSSHSGTGELKLIQPATYEFECPHCKSLLEGDNTMMGKKLDCPSCKKPILIDT